MKQANSTSNIYPIILRMLSYLDKRIVGHGERVAYIAKAILENEEGLNKNDIVTDVFLALLHDIGAIKTEEVDKILNFDTGNVYPHCLYGSLFIKHFSPIGNRSDVILYHHTPFNQLREGLNEAIANIIFLSDRIDILMDVIKSDTLDPIYKLSGTSFNPIHVEAFKKVNKDNILLTKIKDGRYKEELNDFFMSSDFDFEPYFLLMVDMIDFKSYQTVVHSYGVACFSYYIAQLFHLDEKERSNLVKASFAHDIGKIAIPNEILEKPGKLTKEEYEVMKTHVTITKEILTGLVPLEILEPAVNHHERLDGSGYPTRKSYLSLEDQILIYADILSALSFHRLYREDAGEKNTIMVLDEMVNHRQLSAIIWKTIRPNFHTMLVKTKKITNHVQNEFDAMVNEVTISLKQASKEEKKD
jgi:HD-GYP domain-containing protein (c-di-GMP phosphodiesterase class II)